MTTQQNLPTREDITRVCSFSHIAARGGLALALAALAPVAWSQVELQTIGFGPGEQPDAYDYVVSGEHGDEIDSAFQALSLDEVLYWGEVEDLMPPEDPPPASAVIAPALETLLTSVTPETWIELIVSVPEPAPFPALPPLPHDFAEESPEFQQALGARAQRFDEARLERLASQQSAAQLVTNLGGEVTAQLTLCNCFAARLQAAWVGELAAHPEVSRLEADQASGELTAKWSTPQGAGGGARVSAARARINSDGLYHQGWGRGHVGVIDSGVGYWDDPSQAYRYHDIFRCSASDTSPRLIDERLNCSVTTSAGGQQKCSSQNATFGGEDQVATGHGTRTIAILNGLDSLGSDFRGLTRAQVDSYKVLGSNWLGISPRTVLIAIDHAALQSDVILINLEFPGSAADAIARSVDSAFDAGIVVVSSVGNSSSSSSLPGVPASASKVIAVGAYALQNSTTLTDQRRGPLADGRRKPEVQFPSNTKTAATAPNGSSATDCQNCLQVYGKTSGAAPYGAGAAVLMRDWFYRPTAWTRILFLEPGLVYASLVALGDRHTPAGFIDEHGAGRVTLPKPDSSRFFVGRRTLDSANRTQVVRFEAGASDSGLEIGVWWPDDWSAASKRYAHQAIQVELKDPSGVTVATGADAKTVFHRLAVNGTPKSGTWELILKGPSGMSRQPVYYAVHRPSRPLISFFFRPGFWGQLESILPEHYLPLVPAEQVCP